MGCGCPAGKYIDISTAKHILREGEEQRRFIYIEESGITIVTYTDKKDVDLSEASKQVLTPQSKMHGHIIKSLFSLEFRFIQFHKKKSVHIFPVGLLLYVRVLCMYRPAYQQRIYITHIHCLEYVYTLPDLDLGPHI